jgi:hypothetical protein
LSDPAAMSVPARPRSAAARLYRNIADTLSLFALPAFAARLPWPIAFRVLKLLAFTTPAFRFEANVAWREATAYVGDRDGGRWRRRFRLVRWVERVDAFLAVRRPAAWWLRQIDVHGDIDALTAPSLVLTCHWGAGAWIWTVLREHGIRARFLARRPDVRDFGRSRIAQRYAELRERALARAGCAGVIFLGDSSARMRAAWDVGESVLGMIDVPADPARRWARVSLLGREARLPSGLLHRAAASGVPTVIVTCGIDVVCGRRVLHVERIADGVAVDDAAALYATHLDARLREAPELWHLWHEARSMFVADGDAPHV